MNNISKVFIGIYLLLLIVVALSLGYYFDQKKIQNKEGLSLYYSRRDDLEAQYQTLQKLINELNTTVQTEKIKVQLLSAQLSEEQSRLSTNPLPSPTILPQPTLVPKPTPQPVTQPVPQPLPRRVTRAS